MKLCNLIPKTVLISRLIQFLDHISLHAALGSLSNLVELHITYQLRNVGVEYRKDQFQFTNNDAKTLAYGLEKCRQLKIFRYVLFFKIFIVSS